MSEEEDKLKKRNGDLLAVLRGEKTLAAAASDNEATEDELRTTLQGIVRDQVRAVKAETKNAGRAAGELKVEKSTLEYTVQRYWERQARIQNELIDGKKTAAEVASLLFVQTTFVEAWRKQLKSPTVTDLLKWKKDKTQPPDTVVYEGPLPPPDITRQLMEVLQDGRSLTTVSGNLSERVLKELKGRVDRYRRYLAALTYHPKAKYDQKKVEALLGGYRFRPAATEDGLDPDGMEKLRWRKFRQLLPPTPLLELVNAKAAAPPLVDDLPPHKVYLDTVQEFVFDDGEVAPLVPVVKEVQSADGYDSAPVDYVGAEQIFVVFGELELAFTSRFDKRWTDKGSTAKLDTGLFHPIPPIGFKALGSYACGRHNLDPTEEEQWAVCVRASRYADTRYPPLAAPHGYWRVWCDKMSTAKDGNGSVWRPIPPEGYVALGDVAMSGHGTAPGNDTVCVRRDLTVPGEFGPFITDDKGSGGWQDLSLWKLVAPTSFTSLDPDIGCIAIGGFVCLRNSDRNYDKVRRAFSDSWSQIAHCLFLPFPRKEHAVVPTQTEGAQYRTVWVPMSAINAVGVGAEGRAQSSPFYRLEIRTSGTARAGGRLGDDQYVPHNRNPRNNGKDEPDYVDRAFTNRVRLPASVTRLLYGDLASVSPDRSGGSQLHFYVEVLKDDSTSPVNTLSIGASALVIK